MKPNQFWRLLFALAVVAQGFAQSPTVPVPQSGIDWRSSTLTVQRFQPADKSHRESFKCFEQDFNALPIVKTLNELGFNNPDSGPLTLPQVLENSACFQQAGWYDINIEFYDFARNSSEYQTVLTVEPSELSMVDSTLEPVASQTSGNRHTITDLTKRATCTSTTLIADGTDECILELKLRDRFANVIAPESLEGELVVTLPTDQAAKNYDAKTDPYGAYLAGLYFENGNKDFSWDLPVAQSPLRVGLKGYVPSLSVPDESTPLEAVTVEAQPIEVGLAFRSADVETAIVSTQKIIEPLFSPWVKVLADPSGSLQNFVTLPLNRQVTLPLSLSTVSQKPLPERILVDWEAPTLENLWLRFKSEEKDQDTSLTNLVAVTESPQPLEVGVTLVAPDGADPNQSFLLDPVVAYQQLIRGKKSLVRYPTSLRLLDETLALEPFKPLQLKAAIIGKTIDQSLENENTVVLSGREKIIFTKWREQLNRQAISLIRGLAPKGDTTFNLSSGWGDRDIAYFKGVDVVLTSDDPGSAPMIYNQGVKTLIVEDGNVLISRDINYASNEDSLGVVVINSEANDAFHGHVFVHQNVQHFVGSYFLDGALVSTLKLDSPDVNDEIPDREKTPNENTTAPLALQLVLEGVLFSRNTLGGADETISRGLAGNPLRRELAVIFDLNYLRRYEPVFASNGLRVADSENEFCYKPDNKTCYPHSAPLVIQYDGRVQQLPPPGFAEK